MTPPLNAIALLNAEAARNPKVLFTPGDLALVIGIDPIRFHDGNFVDVGLFVHADAPGGDAAIAMKAMFRLDYGVALPTTEEARIAFAVQHAVPSAWPEWRTWVIQTCGWMGLGPPPVPPRAPLRAVNSMGPAFDLVEDVEAAVREGMAPQPGRAR